MSNKDAALSFLRLVTRGQVQRAYDEHVGPGFRHHNPYFPGDAESLRAGMQASEDEHPGKLLEIKQAIAEGDRVAVHSHLRMSAGDRGMATMHIFRFGADGRIAELWDMWMQAPADSPNENGMF